MDFKQEDVEEINKKLNEVLADSPFILGSEAYIDDGKIKSKPTLVLKPVSKKAPDTKPEQGKPEGLKDGSPPSDKPKENGKAA